MPSTNAQQQLVGESGYWFRHKHYEIADGYIRPAKGAGFERYDPWEKYRADEEDDPPYVQLIETVQNLDFEIINDGPRYLISPASKARIEEWCNVYGLLGVLPAHVSGAWFAPRWKRHEGTLRPSQRRVIQTPYGWREITEYPPVKDKGAVRGKLEGALVTGKQASALPVQSGCMIRGVGGFAPMIEPLSKTWAHYFPSVEESAAETFDYPFIGDEQFFEFYAEPLGAFIEAARVLSDAVLALGYWKEAGGDITEVIEPTDSLHALVFGARFAVHPLSGGEFTQQWVCPSLLTSLALMALRDLTERRRVFPCEVCGKFIVTSAYQSRYCSERCARTAQQRRYRERKRDKNKANEGGRRKRK